jgi:hypothetical protein
MTPDTTTANPQSTAPVTGGTSTKAKVRQKSIIRFPYQFHAGVTPAMNRSIMRMTASNSLAATADIIRMALHNYLLANDPLYHQEISGGNGHA